MPNSSSRRQYLPRKAIVSGRFRRKIAELETLEGELSMEVKRLQDSERHYRTLVRHSLAGFFIFQGGVLRYVTQRLADILGYDEKDELLGKHLWEFAHPDDRAMIWHLTEGSHGCRANTSRYCFRALRADGTTIWLELDTVDSTFDGKPAQVGNLVDISGQNNTEHQLKQNRRHLEEHVASRTDQLQQANKRLQREIAERKEIENRLVREKQFSHYIIESLPGIFYVLDEAGRFLEWNRNLEIIGEYSSKEISKMAAMDFYTGQEKELIAQRIRDVFQFGKAFVEVDIVAKNGARIPFLQTGVRMELEEGAFLVGIGVDIGKRIRAEQALRKSEKELKVLSSQLLDIQEKERGRLARELHDGIGQTMTAIKFGLENAHQKVLEGDSEDVAGILEAMVPMIQGAVNEIRRMSKDLRPSVLDDLGILAALKWFCREFSSIYGDIKVQRRIEVQEREVPQDLKTTIYRFVQEAMNNAAKHSKAGNVSLSLTRHDGILQLKVQDDGKGFNVEAVLASSADLRGFGLASLRERTELSGGRFNIYSARESGTLLTASWPVHM